MVARATRRRKRARNGPTIGDLGIALHGVSLDSRDTFPCRTRGLPPARVFDYDYQEIAGIVEKSEENCRQIFARAKRHIDAGKPRFDPSREKRDELARRFFAACQEGSLQDLVNLLAADATFYGDGGGKATAVLKPVLGADRVARLIFGTFTKGRPLGVRLHPVHVNGEPGAMIYDAEDRLISVFALEIVDGAIRAIRSVINPDKLTHLGELSSIGRLPKKPE